MTVEHLDVVLDAKLGPLDRALTRADAKLAKTEAAMGRVKIGRAQSAESRAAVREIADALDGIPIKAVRAAERLDRVKLGSDQAVESVAAADVIDRKLQMLRSSAFLAERGLEGVKITETQATESEVAGGRIERALNRISRAGVKARLAGGRNGSGVGPFGSGFGRIGLLGAGVGAGALTAPAAGPGAAGLLASIPTLAAAGAGALATLLLGFRGVGKAIGGDKKAYDRLTASQQKFARTVRSLNGWMQKLKQTAAGGMFPGLTKGLQAALSPQAVKGIATAVNEFAHAIGQAGEQWGRYFGSSKFQSLFGPLMAAGARGFTLLSQTALSLFDALGVLGRAAIPFTTWLETSAAAGARWVDRLVRAKDASGGLAGGLNEAKSSLILVARLAVSLGGAVYALGAALYPVAKVAVADLTAGLDGLVGILNRNKKTIQTVAMMFVDGLATGIHIAVVGIGYFNDALSKLLGKKAAVVTAVLLIGAVIAMTLGPGAAVILGVILAVGLIKEHWSGLVDFFKTLGQEIINIFDYAWVQIERGAVKMALGVLRALDFKILGKRLIPGVNSLVKSLQAQLDSLHPPNLDWSTAALQAGINTGAAWRRGFDSGHGVKSGPVLNPTPKKHDPKPGSHAWYMKYLGYDPTTDTGNPFGTDPAFTKNLGPKTPFTPLPSGLATQLANAQANAQSGGLKDLQLLEQVEKRAIAYLNQEHVTGKKLVAVAKERLTITRQLAQTEKLISQQQAARREDRILGLAPGGGQTTPGAVALRRREHNVLVGEITRSFGGGKNAINLAAQKLGISTTTLLHKTNNQLLAEMKRMGIVLPKATLDSLNKINTVLKEKFIPPDVRENIRARLQQIEETLKTSSKKLASNYKPVHSTDVVKGLGLDRAQKLAVESRVSQALAHGGMAPTGGAAAGIPLATGVGLGSSGQVQYVTFGDVQITITGGGKNAKQIAAEVRAELLKHSARNGGRDRTVH